MEQASMPNGTVLTRQEEESSTEFSARVSATRARIMERAKRRDDDEHAMPVAEKTLRVFGHTPASREGEIDDERPETPQIGHTLAEEALSHVGALVDGREEVAPKAGPRQAAFDELDRAHRAAAEFRSDRLKSATQLEAIVACHHAITYALLDVADAIRGQAR